MSETPTIKLNLKALGRKEDAQELLKDEAIIKATLKDPKLIIQEVGKKPLTPLKSSLDNTSTEDGKLLDTLDGSTIVKDKNLKDTTSSTENDVNKKKGFIQLESINKYVADEKKNRKEEKAQQEIESKEDEKKDKEDKKDSESDIHFDNYISHFEKQSKNVFKRIRNFRYTPKTRTGLILSLIVFTSLIIGGLIVFFPEKHSISIYKASILQIYDQSSYTKSRGEVNQNSGEDGIQGESNNFDPPIDTTLEETIEVKSEIDKEEIKKKKVKDHLLNKYAS